MAIFLKKISEEEYVTHEELMEQIGEYMKINHPKWKCLIFSNQKELHDLLLIRTFKKMVNKAINSGSPNPITKEKEEYLQIVLPITIDIENIIDKDELYEQYKDWAYAPLIIPNMRTFIRKFTQIEKENL